uniref:DUF7748 domain-containing protein n=1 Tax=Physcomitrium patens TaxID=3218 RepID=A0A2K1IET1_PHYPA|nr:hypothetical protein PHYPA_029936 [Physcomitrium patens]
MKTKFINDSSLTIKLMEGNAGAFRGICELSKTDSYKVEVNPNATYREYMAATGSKGERLILSEEEVYKHSTIRIVDDYSKPEKFRFQFENPRVEGETHAPRQLLFKWWDKLISRIRSGEVGSDEDGGSAKSRGGQNVVTSHPDAESSPKGSGG